MSIRVLGPTDVLVDGVPCDLPSRRQRALLAALVVRDGRPVSVSDLVDAVWDDDPPEGARTTLQTYVSRLRGVVGPDTVLHSPAGYRLGDTVTTDLADVREAVTACERLDRRDPRFFELATRALVPEHRTRRRLRLRIGPRRRCRARTPLIGRIEQLDMIRNAMDTARPVTVVGVGGVGKTRLVAEFAEEERTSMPLLAVELAPVTSDRVLATLGAALGVRDERVGTALLCDVIGSDAVLIVLDNAEHVIDVVRDLVHDMLSACPSVRFVVTSRERLALTAEAVVALAPLNVDGPHADAVKLFVDRLRRARPHTDLDGLDTTIAEMCRRLDGIPLTLELAAGRAATLGVSVLHERFDSTSR